MGTPFCVDPAPGGVAARSSRPPEEAHNSRLNLRLQSGETRVYLRKRTMQPPIPGVAGWGGRVCWDVYCRSAMVLTRHRAPSRMRDTR